MANSLKLWETYNVIVENQHRWLQSAWAAGDTNPAAKDYTECGTSFCVAGWAARLNGYKPMVEKLYNGQLVAQGSYFVPNCTPPEETYIEACNAYSDELDAVGAKEAREIAKKLFELNVHEACVLFSVHAVNDDEGKQCTEKLRNLIENIIAGNVCAKSGSGECLGGCGSSMLMPSFFVFDGDDDDDDD